MDRERALIDNSPFVSRVHDRRRWRRLSWTLLLALVGDAIITTVLFLGNHHAVTITNHNALIQRKSQYIGCVKDNARAAATITYAKGQLAAQERNLKQALTLPAFRDDPKLAELGTASIREQISLYGAWLKPYQLSPCLALYGINGHTP